MKRTAPCPNGVITHLEAGDYKATVVSVGASLARLTWRGVDLVVPFHENDLQPAYLGKTLLPWVNRIADGKYRFRGVAHELPINEHSTNTALHGLGCWVDWDIAEVQSNEVTLCTTLVPRYGYPFHIRAEVNYRIGPEGLKVTITSTNVGKTAAPYGSSSHPYLTCGLAPVDECTLTSPAESILTVDERLLPVKELSVIAADLDFRQGQQVGPRQIDHAFGQLPNTEWQTSLHHPASGITARMTAQAPWMQIYTGDLIGRQGVAVEPMTSPPNAYNSEKDLIVLEPDESHTLQFRIDGVHRQ